MKLYLTSNWWILLALLAALVHTRALAADNLIFKPLSTSSHLPTNEIRNLYQDSEGYIWISTYNGLLRFDGYNTVIYRPDGQNQNRNLDGFVNIVAEDHENHLWIGTYSGLYVLDKRQDKLEKISSPLLQVSYIEAIACTKNGDVWVGANKGIFRRKAGSDQFELCDPQIQKTSLPHYDVKSIIEDRNGNIWIGTWAQGLIRYNPQEEKYYTYRNINPAESAHTLFQDSRGQIWIGTWRYGLTKLENPYDMKHYRFKHFVHDEANPGSLCDNIIYAIAQDHNSGKLWIGSRSGLSILESEEGKDVFSNYLPGKGPDTLPFNEVDALMYSRDGLMWVGMLGGGVYTVNTHRKLFDYDSIEPLLRQFPTSSIRSAYPSDHHSIYMGVMGYGLVEYDPTKQTILHYREHPGFRHMPYISTVNDIIRRSDQTYCFATWDDGVWIYDGKKAYAINQQTHPALTDVCVYSLYEDRQGNLWIGTRNGLCMLDIQGKMHSIDQLCSNDKQAWPQVPVFKITEDNAGNIWVATPNNGIWRFTPQKDRQYAGKIYAPSHHNSQSVGAMTLCTDSKGRIWAGTNGNGLDLYVPQDDRFISVFNEYFETGDVIFSMLEDNFHSLWLTTNSQMYHINPSSDNHPRIYTYTMEEGLQDHIFNRNSCFKANDGSLVFGGAHGLNSFLPEAISHDSTSYPVVITDLKIYETSIRNLPAKEQERILDAPLDYASHIILPYDKNNFSLDFSILSYVNPQLNKYRYRLEGYDAGWISTNALRHFAYYNNLPSGKYTFKVRGANPNGVWSRQECELHITILPPPWLSWWAYCLYILAAAAVIYYLYRTIRKRIQMQHAIELGKIQRQQIEAINHAKLQFFTNITHELLTPLSIISASVDELKLQYPDLKPRLRSISDNTLRLVRLIQQILEFRKVENGKQKLRVSQGNLTLFLRQSANAFAPLVRKRQLHISVEDADHEIIGYFDPDKMDKILYNLLSNAAKYTQEGRCITIRQQYIADKGLYVFSVNNPGELIPADKQVHLFERFYEGEYRKFHTIGTGIGLSLTKDLVLLHHGTIGVTSDTETGNTFTVSIPITQEAYSQEEREEEKLETENPDPNISESTDTQASVPSPLPHIDNGHHSRSSILIVEDNEELREAMHRLLSQYYQVSEAPDGSTALKILEVEPVDLVVSDVMMPGMDGMELCKRIKVQFQTAHIPVILLTARTGSQDRVEGYEAGADGYICKPLNFSVLIAKIENLLKSRRQPMVDARKTLVFEAKEINYTPDDEQFLKKAMECVNAHLDEQDFDLGKFVAAMGMARSTLNDKLKQLTGMTPLSFISNVRLQAAFRLLEENRKIRINDLAYKVGFNDPKYFTLCFRKKFGVSPKEYLTQKEKEKTGTEQNNPT